MKTREITIKLESQDISDLVIECMQMMRNMRKRQWFTVFFVILGILSSVVLDCKAQTKELGLVNGETEDDFIYEFRLPSRRRSE
jgi:hypothetical protein